MPLAQVVKYHNHGKVYYGYHYGDTFNFTNETNIQNLLKELTLDGIGYIDYVSEIDLKNARQEYRQSIGYSQYKDQLITKYQIFNYLINRCSKTQSLLNALFLSTTELEVEVTLLRYEYEQLTNEIPEEEQCFYDYYCRCDKNICPHYRECDYSVKEVK